MRGFYGWSALSRNTEKKNLSALEPELFIELSTRTFKFSVTDTDPDANFCSNDNRDL